MLEKCIGYGRSHLEAGKVTVSDMRKDRWSKIKKYNNEKELHLEVEDQWYIDKVIGYTFSQGMGMMETEVIRRDLIGMAMEAKEAGESLEKRLGSVEVFAQSLAQEGKSDSKRERIHYMMWEFGSAWLIGNFLLYIVNIVSCILYVSMGLEESRAILSALYTVPKIYVNVFVTVLCVLPAVEFYRLFLKYKWILKKGMGKLIPVLEILVVAVIYVFLYKPRQAAEAAQYASYFTSYFPTWVYLLLLLLCATAYWYGKKKFNAYVDGVEQKYHIDFNNPQM